MNNEKCLFKKDLVDRAKVLQNQTIRYVAKNKIGISEVYLSNILSGKIHCSKIIANRITQSICKEAKLEDYFEVIK